MWMLHADGMRAIGKPKDWDDEKFGSCGTVLVVDHDYPIEGVDNAFLHYMFSFYRPTEEELAELNKGGVLRLGFPGRNHPVFQLATMSASIAEECQFVDSWNMGGVQRHPTKPDVPAPLEQYPTEDAYLRACRALHWHTAQLRANGIEPLPIPEDAPQYPPDDYPFKEKQDEGS